MKYYNILNSVNSPPQTQLLPNTNQQKNNAGGYSYVITPFEQLKRFLVLGSNGGTYYSSPKTLTLQNMTNILECLKLDFKRTVNIIIEMSYGGRIIKNETAVFALAACWVYSSEVRKYIRESRAHIQVCRIATHLFQWNSYIEMMGGKWNTHRRKAIEEWYNNFSDKDLELQVLKYQSREGWSHSDLLRVAHPTVYGTKNDILNYAVHGYSQELSEVSGLNLIHVYEDMKGATDTQSVIHLINRHNLTWELVPSHWLGDAKVWEALLPNLPATALRRNLSRLTANGLLSGMNSNVKFVVNKMKGYIDNKNVRLHPAEMLLAWNQYKSGMSPNLYWTPIRQVSDILEYGFYKRMESVQPTNKNFAVWLDVSGSMSGLIPGLNMSSVMAGAALVLQLAKTEPWTFTAGFCSTPKLLNFSATDNLEIAMGKAQSYNFGSTDCAQPMLYATKYKHEVDCFVVVTDNETYVGNVHPSRALDEYRQKSGRNAKLVVLATTATNFSIADSAKPYMLDLVGFDSNVPKLIQEFAGELYE